MRSFGMGLVLAVAACGGGKGGGLGLAEALDQNIDNLCAHAFECQAQFPTDKGFMFEDIFGTNEAACVANFDANSQNDEILASVDAGRIIYDPGDFANCTNFIDDLSCVDFWGSIFDMNPPSPASCDRALEGTVPTGGICTIDLDCVDNGTCGSGGTGMVCM